MRSCVSSPLRLSVYYRGAGGHITIHGGGPKRDGTIGAGIVAGHWAVQYVSLIVALNDIGPGDGATCLVVRSNGRPLAASLRTETHAQGGRKRERERGRGCPHVSVHAARTAG